MILRMQEAKSSKKLSCVQQAAHISLKQKLLKIEHFRKEPEPDLGACALPFGVSLDSIV
jgi:hypothetical protein